MGEIKQSDKADLFDWRVEIKHRKDLVKLNPNFRKQNIDALPGDERPYHLLIWPIKMTVEVMVIKSIRHYITINWRTVSFSRKIQSVDN